MITYWLTWKDITDSRDAIASKKANLLNEIKRKRKFGKSVWDLIGQCYSYPKSFKINEIENLLREDFCSRNPDLSKIEVDQRIKIILGKKYVLDTTDRRQYFDDKIEFVVQDKIYEVAVGKPGLLLRGLKCRVA